MCLVESGWSQHEDSSFRSLFSLCPCFSGLGLQCRLKARVSPAKKPPFCVGDSVHTLCRCLKLSLQAPGPLPPPSPNQSCEGTKPPLVLGESCFPPGGHMTACRHQLSPVLVDVRDRNRDTGLSNLGPDLLSHLVGLKHVTLCGRYIHCK